MDERKDDDVSVSNDLELSTVTASEHAGSDDSEKTTVVVESVSTEVQVLVHDQSGKGQIEGSSEEMVAEEGGGSCNGADIMVGVMGSDVNVDGVCIHDSGAGSAGNTSEEAAHGGSNGSVKVGLERNLKNSGSGDGVVGDLGSEGMGESGAEVLNSGTENEIGGSPTILESTAEGALVEGGDVSGGGGGGGDLVDDKTLQEAGAVDVAAPKVEIAGSSVVESCSGGKAGLAVKDVVVFKREESLEGGGLPKDGEINGTGDVNSLAVGASENEAQDQRVENGVESNSVGLGCLVGEAKVVEEKSELVEEAAEQPKEKGGSDGDALQYSETQKAGVLHDEVLNPGTESVTSTILVDSNVGIQVVEEAMGNDDSLDVKVKGPESDALEGAPGGDPLEGIISRSERVLVSTDKDGIANTTSKSLHEQVQVAVGGDLASSDNKSVACPDIEGMDTDAFNENFYFSVEELQATVETVNGSTESGYNKFADSHSLHQQPQVTVGAEVTAKDNKVLLTSGKDQKLVNECLDQSMARDFADLHSNVELEIGVDKRVVDSKQAGLQTEQKITVAEQQKLVVVNGSTGNHDNVYLDSTTSCQSTQAVFGHEVAEIDYKVLSDSNFAVSDYVDFGVSSSSGNDQHPRIETTSGEMEMDTQAALTNNEKVLTSNAAQVEGGSEKEQQLKLEECLDKSVSCVDDEIGSDGKANSNLVSSSSSKKRKGSDSFADDLSMPEGRKTISLEKVSTAFPKPSFKIGECISRAASQITGSSSIIKCDSQKLDGSSDVLVGDVSDASFQQSEDAETKRVILPTGYSSLDELLSQLHLAARDPLKGYSFFNIIISFFSDFRNSVIMEQHDKVGSKRRKTSQSFGGSPETFEFDDMSYTYQTEWVIQNGSEEQSLQKSRKSGNLFVPVELGKTLNRSKSRKRCYDGNYDVSREKPVGYVDEKAPAELVMHFPVVDSVPSETNLNKMFKHFGPLIESETEIDRDTNRARVVFKRCSDAEAAYGSAPKFNIFGPMLVNYQLNYTISEPFKTSTQGEDDATLYLQV